MPTRKSTRKKMERKFRPGQWVTWGNGSVSHEILSVEKLGVVVDSTSSGFGRPDKQGRLTMLIEFAPGSKSHRCPGPPRLVR